MEGPDTLVATAAYQPEPMAAAAARRFVRDTLQSWVVTGAGADGTGPVDDAVLLTSELVTNAVVHAGTPVQVTCRLADGTVEVVVRDDRPTSLVPEPPDAGYGSGERTSGRGLLLPSALASAWGVTYGRAGKAVWFRIGLDGPGTAADDGAGGPAGGDPAALATAFRRALAAPAAQPAAGVEGCRAPAGPGYRELLQQTAEAARAAVSADAACVLLADEDGELRVRAAAGGFPRAGSPPVTTIPFVVDGRVTGLLAAVRVRPESFRDAETARLQELADRAGPALERARLSDLDRARRERLSALAVAGDLLAGHLSPDKVMALAGEAVVPRLSVWCAVLLPGADGVLHPAHTRHRDESRAPALTWLLERVCAGGAAPAPPPARPGAGHRAAWRWALAGEAGDGTAAAPGTAAPPGTAALTADVACCFPFPLPRGSVGVLAAGCREGERLPREAAALIADLACRLGLALGSAAPPGHAG